MRLNRRGFVRGAAGLLLAAGAGRVEPVRRFWPGWGVVETAPGPYTIRLVGDWIEKLSPIDTPLLRYTPPSFAIIPDDYEMTHVHFSPKDYHDRLWANVAWSDPRLMLMPWEKCEQLIRLIED